MRSRLLLLVATLAAVAATSASIGTQSALACDTSFWNISSEYYTPTEGHTCTAFCCSIHERVNSTFDPYDTVLVILTTAGGSWISSNTMGYNGTTYLYAEHTQGEKVGCYNHHTGTQWVNCRHLEGW
jgi:hypothetical protein